MPFHGQQMQANLRVKQPNSKTKILRVEWICNCSYNIQTLPEIFHLNRAQLPLYEVIGSMKEKNSVKDVCAIISH